MLRLLGARSGLAALLFAVALASLVTVACGTEGGGQGEGAPAKAAKAEATVAPKVQKILDTGQAFAFDDLLAAGFKKGKTYNVEGLEKAVAAYYGFYGLDPYNRQEYEVRFYESHDDAIVYGIPMADEVTGVDTRIVETLLTWKAHKTEVRQCLGLGTHSHHVHSCDTPKYADYVVRGNMILMCEGLALDVSQQHCKDVLTAMGVK